MKTYLGDGVYVEFQERSNQLVLTAEDGTSASDTIYIEPDIWDALVRFVREVWTTV